MTTRFLPITTLVAALAACGTSPSAPSPRDTPAAVAMPDPSARTRDYRLDAARSKILVLVYRDGPMAGLGHNHVISPGTMHGCVQLTTDGTATVDIAVASSDLEVDRPVDRAVSGPDFTAPLSTGSADATRRNLLGEAVLDADRHPWIRLRGSVADVAASTPRFAGTLALREGSVPVDVPVAIAEQDGSIQASGAFTFKQTDAGMTPFSVMMGLLRVRDTVDVRFSLTAVPLVPRHRAQMKGCS